ncbi:MAG: hypothetical protein PVSMB7_26570 [Chloroflexota bacterium]
MDRVSQHLRGMVRGLERKINPCGPEIVANGFREALEMSVIERRRRIEDMAARLEERNVYAWATEFMKDALDAARPTFDQVA